MRALQHGTVDVDLARRARRDVRLVEAGHLAGQVVERGAVRIDLGQKLYVFGTQPRLAKLEQPVGRGGIVQHDLEDGRRKKVGHVLRPHARDRPARDGVPDRHLVVAKGPPQRKAATVPGRVVQECARGAGGAARGWPQMAAAAAGVVHGAVVLDPAWLLARVALGPAFGRGIKQGLLSFGIVVQLHVIEDRRPQVPIAGSQWGHSRMHRGAGTALGMSMGILGSTAAPVAAARQAVEPLVFAAVRNGRFSCVLVQGVLCPLGDGGWLVVGLEPIQGILLVEVVVHHHSRRSHTRNGGRRRRLSAVRGGGRARVANSVARVSVFSVASRGQLVTTAFLVRVVVVIVVQHEVASQLAALLERRQRLVRRRRRHCRRSSNR